jgi:hypothetical protein
MSFRVIDDFLPREDFILLRDYVMGDQFAWHRLDGVVERGDGYQFVTTVFNKHEWYLDARFLKSFVDALDPIALCRIKMNLQYPESTPKETAMHTDMVDQKMITSVFYLNTCDGYTRFETGEKVESVENRIVFFDSRTKHCGCSSTEFRYVINTNFFPTSRSQWIELENL